MNIAHAAPQLAKWPEAARYDGGDLVLTGEFPEGFTGDVNEMYKLGLKHGDSNEGMSTEGLMNSMSSLRADASAGKLIQLSKPQGKYLHANHAAFADEPEE